MARPMTWLIVVTTVFVLVALTVLTRRTGERREIRTTLSLADALGTDDTAGYARAYEPRSFDFPGDHAAHPDFATEWWYFTGNLESAEGRRFGYQLTFFRRALSAHAPERASAWATRQAWMAHFALTDVHDSRFFAHERFARGALKLAGATAAPFRVWLEDWRIEGDDSNAFPARLRAADDSVAIDLVVEPAKPIVLQGERGLSRKGPEPGNASYYYSMTRLRTSGMIQVAGQDFAVTGSSWLDREWSTSALRAGLAGWDWFALQFDDNTELMLYRLRGMDGSTDPFSAGTFVHDDGTTADIVASDIEIDETASWRSPIDGTSYPAAWTLRVARLDLAVDIEPLLSDQELNLAVRYWEGAVDATARRAGVTQHGRGYVELTGYAGLPKVRGRAP